MHNLLPHPHFISLKSTLYTTTMVLKHKSVTLFLKSLLWLPVMHNSLQPGFLDNGAQILIPSALWAARQTGTREFLSQQPPAWSSRTPLPQCTLSNGSVLWCDKPEQHWSIFKYSFQKVTPFLCTCSRVWSEAQITWEIPVGFPGTFVLFLLNVTNQRLLVLSFKKAMLPLFLTFVLWPPSAFSPTGQKAKPDRGACISAEE